jgi:hypothetical protein
VLAVRGYRKMLAGGAVLLVLFGGLFATRDAGVYAAFAGACVALAGLFFNANVKTHQAQAKGE